MLAYFRPNHAIQFLQQQRPTGRRAKIIVSGKSLGGGPLDSASLSIWRAMMYSAPADIIKLVELGDVMRNRR